MKGGSSFRGGASASSLDRHQERGETRGDGEVEGKEARVKDVGGPERGGEGGTQNHV